MTWTPTHPDLDPVKECPVGMILRETPQVYEALELYSYTESGAVNPFECSPWVRQAFGIVGGEQSRQWKRKREQERTVRDSEFAKRR